MKNFYVFSYTVYFICLGVSIVLIMRGFHLPPPGVVDGSVISIVGELLTFAVIGMIPAIIHAGKGTKVTTRGGTTIEVRESTRKEASDETGD